MPAVSVIIATYNRLTLLPRALDGLVGQTFTDFEVIVINDAGPDPSRVIDRYSDRLDIRLITNPVNLGVGPTQNVGLAAARGSYLCVCSDDDRYLPTHLQTLHEAAVAQPGTIPYTDGNEVLENEAGVVVRRRHIETPNEFSRADLLIQNYLPSLSMLIPLAAIEEVGAFDEDLDVLEDWELWIRLSDRYPFVHHPTVTFEYHLRGRSGNLTTRDEWRFDRCLKQIYARYPVEPTSRSARLRQQILNGTAHRAGDYLFDVSYIVAGGGEPDRLLAALQGIVSHATDHTYEIVVIVPRTDAFESLAAQITGDVSFVFTDSNADPATLGARRATGRHHHVIADLADLRLDEAFTPALA